MPVTTHATWEAERLWQQLQPLLPGLSVEVLARCDSTNTRLLERARLGRPGRQSDVQTPGGPTRDAAAGGAGRRAGDLEPTLLVAEHQTNGRGRMGRSWQGTPGAALSFSLGLPLAPLGWSGLSLAVGLALAQALEPQPAAGAPRVALKWPNDLWLMDAPGRGRKLGGVLIETQALGNGADLPRLTVVGVGLNVLPQQLHELNHGYACAAELLPDVSAPALLHRVAEPLVRALLAFQTQGFAPLVAAYAARDLLRGQAVTTTQAGLPDGLAEGVDADGALLVRRDGDVHRVLSGEVSVRLQAPGGDEQPGNEAGDDLPGTAPC